MLRLILLKFLYFDQRLCDQERLVILFHTENRDKASNRDAWSNARVLGGYRLEILWENKNIGNVSSYLTFGNAVIKFICGEKPARLFSPAMLIFRS